MPSTPQSARELVRRLIELEESRPRSVPAPTAAPLEVSYRLHLILCRSVGGIGCSTLTSRALRTAALEHPVLAELTVHSDGRPYFKGVDEAVERFDASIVAAGMLGYLEVLIGLLARFVGDDVVISLAERLDDAEAGDPEHEEMPHEEE